MAPDGNYYDPVATIFIDGKYVGEVNATSRNDQEIDFWDEDPGYDFTFSFIINFQESLKFNGLLLMVITPTL